MNEDNLFTGNISELLKGVNLYNIFGDNADSTVAKLKDILAGEVKGSGIFDRISGGPGTSTTGKITNSVNFATDILGSVLPNKQYTTNSASATMGDYDFSTDMTRSQYKKYSKGMGIANTVTSVAKQIPGIGGAVAGVTDLLLNKTGLGKAIFGGGAPSQKEIIADYMATARGELQQNRAMDFRNAFNSGNIAAYGGILDAKIQNIEGPSHENSPTNGQTISYDSKGVPNKVEGGEVVIDMDGTQFVFTDRF